MKMLLRHALGAALRLLGTLPHGAKWHPINMFVPLCAQEPERQPTGIVVGSSRFRAFRHVGTNSQRALSACLLPPTLLHDDANQHTDRLSQAFGAARVLGTKKAIDCRLSLELPDDSR